MSDEHSFLVDWVIRFLENGDMVRKNIVSIEKNKNRFDFIIKYKDKTKYFIVNPFLEEDILNKIKEDTYFVVISLNNALNVAFVYNNWKKLIKYRFLSLYFINPFSKLDKVWTLTPYTHDKICEKDSLELGLKTMAEMVEPIDKVNLKRNIKLKREEPDL